MDRSKRNMTFYGETATATTGDDDNGNPSDYGGSVTVEPVVFFLDLVGFTPPKKKGGPACRPSVRYERRGRRNRHAPPFTVCVAGWHAAGGNRSRVSIFSGARKFESIPDDVG